MKIYYDSKDSESLYVEFDEEKEISINMLLFKDMMANIYVEGALKAFQNINSGAEAKKLLNSLIDLTKEKVNEIMDKLDENK